MELSTFTCRVPGCGGPASGVCINNLSFKECPDIVSGEGADVEPTSHEAEADPSRSSAPAQIASVMTGGGGSLDAVACDSLLRERGGIVIGIVAGPDVGKTTMIAALYEHATRGKIAGIKFAGSETLRGYEERCHLSRLSSNASKPDTARTPTSAKLSFTHLRIAIDTKVQDVIFSDRSGEHFDNVLNRPPEIAEFSELTRADIILLLVDLHEFQISPHDQTSRLRRLIMAMQSASQLTGKVIRLLGTKADLMKSGAELEAVTASLGKLARDLTGRASGAVIEPIIIASRRGTGPASAGEGFGTIFSLLALADKSSVVFVENTWPSSPTELDLLMRPYRERNK